jgi:hypothetical protein
VARELGKTLRIVDLAESDEVGSVVAWLRANDVKVLNVAGPRESTVPGIYAEAQRFVMSLLVALPTDEH